MIVVYVVLLCGCLIWCLGVVCFFLFGFVLLFVGVVIRLFVICVCLFVLRGNCVFGLIVLLLNGCCVLHIWSWLFWLGVCCYCVWRRLFVVVSVRVLFFFVWLLLVWCLIMLLCWLLFDGWLFYVWLLGLVCFSCFAYVWRWLVMMVGGCYV